LLQGVAPGVTALDLRLGHMEAKATVPAGGINCEIPAVKTVSPDPAQSGEDVTFTIFVPTDANALIPFPCELSAIKVVDTVSIESGAPRFTVIGGTGPTGQAGTVSGNTITFPDIGGYKVGDPPLQVKVVVRLAKDSPGGRLKDEVALTATPINCLTRADAVGRVLGGGAFFGATGARLTGGALTGGGSATDTLRGTANLSGPEVSQPAELPKTGPSTSAVAAFGAAGLGAVLLLRRTRGRPVP
jgi:hypothetical protein